MSLREALLPLVAACLGAAEPRSPAGERPPSAGAGPVSPSAASDSGAAAEGQALGDDQQQQAQQPEAGEPPGELAWVEARMQQVLVAGISPPLEAPLAWLHAQLHAADYFLYVVVHLS